MSNAEPRSTTSWRRRSWSRAGRVAADGRHELTSTARPPAAGRQIGPVGTAARVAGGLAAVVVPITLGGITWWDVGAALVALPLTAIVAAAVVSAAGGARSPGAPG